MDKSKSLYAYIVEYYKQRNKPLAVLFEVTYGCNLNCIHCYNPNRNQSDDLTLDEIAVAAKQMREMGVLDITLTGGELFWRKDWYDIVMIFRRIGFSITIFTNAVMINDEVIEKLINIEPLMIEVSLYGSTQTYYEQVTRVKGSFNRFVNGLALLKNSGLNFVLKPVVLKQNYADWESMLDFAYTNGYRLRFSYSPCLLPSGQKQHDFKLEDDQMVELFRRTSDQTTVVKFIKCGIGQLGFILGPTGDVRPCVPYPAAAGNIRELELKKIWEDSPVFKEVRALSVDEFETCKPCELKQYCEPCLALNLLETGNFRAAKENCRIAANRKLALGKYGIATR